MAEKLGDGKCAIFFFVYFFELKRTVYMYNVCNIKKKCKPLIFHTCTIIDQKTKQKQNNNNK